MMEKIGMRRLHNFEHPLLSDFPDFQTCIAYEIENKHL
jgi:hypothetical protein